MQPLPGQGAAHVAPRIEATLKGRIDDAVISGVVTAERILIGLRGSPNVPAFVISDLSALFRIDRAKIVWHKLAARAYGGTVSSSGMVGYAEAFTGLRSTVEWADVDAGEIPIDATGRELAGGFVRGRLAGRLRVERLGADDRPVLGHGNIVLGAADYPALALATGKLRPYGLPPPAARGTKDLTLAIELQPAGWSFRDIDAAVKGCSATGRVAIGFDGGVDGHFMLALEEAYLSQSTLLTLPAAFTGRVEIPMRVVGWLPRPAVQADVAGAFGRVMSQNRVTSFIDEAVDDVVAVFRGRPSPRAAPPEDEPASPLGSASDGSRGPVNEDALVRELIASGADWDEIEWRLAEVRKGGPRFRVD